MNTPTPPAVRPFAVESLERRLQCSAGLAARAVASAGGVMARPAGNTGTGLFVAGTQVYDANGYPFLLRGFNSTARNGSDAKNLAAIAEAPKTGANAVRTTFGTFGIGVTPAQRQAIAEQYIAEGVVPVVEDHSATGSAGLSSLQTVVDRWLDPANVAWLKKDERNVILNIANEWGPESTLWRDAYISSIARLRAAGVNALLMVDAGGSGQDANTLEQWAKDVEDADPQHNVVFSLHLYNNWRTAGAPNGADVGSSPYVAGAPWDVATEFAKLKAAGIPVVAGEFSQTDGTAVPYDTRSAMAALDGLGVGWLAWSWNQNGNPVHDMMASTAGFQYDSDADLSAFGDLVVNDPTLGTRATARPATTLRPATINGTLSGAAAGRTVYIDDNGNGKLDAGERTTAAAADGTFAFTNLPQGVFALRVAGAAATPAVATLTGGDVATVSLTLSVPAAKASLAGTLFNDTSRDGIRQADEPGVAGRTVYLDLNGDGVKNAAEPAAVTDSKGRYAFKNLTAGTYRVGVALPDGFERTTAVFPAGISTGQQWTNLAVGIDRPPAVGRVSGYFFVDRNADGVQDANDGGQNGKTVFLDLNGNGLIDSGEPTTTTANGAYLFTRVPPGTYTVRADPAGWNVTTPGAAVTVVAGQTATATTIGAVQLPGSIAGFVYADANGDGVIAKADKPLAGVQVYLDTDGNGAYTAGEATVTTDATGGFKFSGLWAGTYAVRAVPPDGQSLTTGSVAATLQTHQAVSGVRLGVGVAVIKPVKPAGVISGIYFNDSNADRRLDAGETPVAKAKVYLDANADGIYDAGDPVRTTAADGSFAFTGLSAGRYALRAVLPAKRALGTPAYDVILSPQQRFTTANLGVVPAQFSVPQVQTLQAESAAPAGGTVASTTYGGYDGAAFADFAGNGSSVEWTFDRPAAGVVDVVFRYANGSTRDRPLTLTLNGDRVGTVDFAPTGRWTTWATTAPLRLALPAGANVLRATAGSAGGANVDAVAFQPVDATASIAGIAFADHNANGKYDGGDGKAKGVTVFLDADDDGLLDAGETSVSTDANGRFRFAGLTGGTYHVRRVTPAGQHGTAADIDLDPGETASGVLLGSVAA